jgi:hypothetical protein
LIVLAIGLLVLVGCCRVDDKAPDDSGIPKPVEVKPTSSTEEPLKSPPVSPERSKEIAGLIEGLATDTPGHDPGSNLVLIGEPAIVPLIESLRDKSDFITRVAAQALFDLTNHRMKQSDMDSYDAWLQWYETEWKPKHGEGK